MKKLLFFFVGSMTSLVVNCQKMPLDYSSLASWPHIQAENISDDGNFVIYFLNSEDQGTQARVVSLGSGVSKTYNNVRDARFLCDSRSIAVMTKTDSMGIINVVTGGALWESNVRSFSVGENEGKPFVFCLLNSGKLLVIDGKCQIRSAYLNVTDFNYSDESRMLVLIQSEARKDLKEISVALLDDYGAKRLDTVWNGYNALNMTFIKDKGGIAFESTFQGRRGAAIWVYQPGMKKASMIVSDTTKGMGKDLFVSDRAMEISNDGTRIFFDVEKAADTVESAIAKPTGIVIWCSRDDQLGEPGGMPETEVMRAVFLTRENRVIVLSNIGDLCKFDEWGIDEFMLACNRVNVAEGYLHKEDRPDVFLVNTRDGQKVCIAKRLLYADPHLSNTGKYVYWYDPEKKAFFTYNTDNKRTTNISVNIPTPVYDECWDLGEVPRSYGIAGWIQGDSGVIVKDRYDLWLCDPDGVRSPVCLTRGFGRRDHIVFRLLYVNPVNVYSIVPKRMGEKVILCAFNEESKQNGFYEIHLGADDDPVRLVMADKAFYFPDNFSTVSLPRDIYKARRADIYLLRCMSSRNFGNLVTTKNFKDFRSVTELEPENKYNWIQTELMKWKTFDGRAGTGILYKPEDFDSKRKYPVIFTFYERLSDGLNVFVAPDLCKGPLNIPWFVSHGYIVFCPDINYTMGHPSQDVYNYVNSAAELLRSKPWVDREALGLYGHSFGGYEVNCLVTRSKLFSAAVSVEGPTDLVSFSGLLRFGDLDDHIMMEVGQNRIGVTLWKNPELYIENSPIFRADSITTPMLLMDNPLDDNVPWSQGLELFTSLRRLGKTAWMLQYDQERHVLDDPKHKMDYTRRLTDFFDYYLKHRQVAKWMESQLIPND